MNAHHGVAVQKVLKKWLKYVEAERDTLETEKKILHSCISDSFMRIKSYQSRKLMFKGEIVATLPDDNYTFKLATENLANDLQEVKAAH